MFFFLCVFFPLLTMPPQGCDKLNPFSGVPAALSSCDMLCAGDALEICGGPNALNVYRFENVAPVLAALASSTSVVNTLITLVNSVTSANVGTVGPVSVHPIFLASFTYSFQQIVSGINGVASSISSTTSASGSAVNVSINCLNLTQNLTYLLLQGGNIPLTDAKASQALSGLIGVRLQTFFSVLIGY
jgi:hypothetical protein